MKVAIEKGLKQPSYIGRQYKKSLHTVCTSRQYLKTKYFLAGNIINSNTKNIL